MEVQTFVLCGATQPCPGGGMSVGNIGLTHFGFARSQMPATLDVPYFMLVRRANTEGNRPFRFEVSVVDEDGQEFGEQETQPVVEGVIPDGHKFMPVSGGMSFVFANGGNYRIDIRGEMDTYHYDMVVNELESQP